MNVLYDALQGLGYTHPLHPLLVPLPLGGLTATLLFALVAATTGRASFAVSARHCSVLAFWAAFPTIALGYLDWQSLHGGNWVHAITMKIILATLLVFVLLVILLGHYVIRASLRLMLPLYVLAFVNAAAIGYYGGEIVFGGAAARQKDATEQPSASTSAQQVSYEAIGRIFEQHCVVCHSGSRAAGGLRLESHDQLMADGGSAVVVPGKPGQSELLRRLTGESEPAMPLGRPLLPEQTVATVARWIEQGAPAE